MYQNRQFDEREQDYSVHLRRKMKEAEAMLLKLKASRERSLALTKLDEALMWANASIAGAGIDENWEVPCEAVEKIEYWGGKTEVRGVSPGRTFINKKKMQEAVDAALLAAKANGAMKEVQVRASRMTEPVEYELFRMEKVASEPNFGKVADAIRCGIEANAPKREETDLRFDIAAAVSKAIHDDIDKAVAEFTIGQGKKEESK